MNEAERLRTIRRSIAALIDHLRKEDADFAKGWLISLLNCDDENARASMMPRPQPDPGHCIELVEPIAATGGDIPPPFDPFKDMLTDHDHAARSTDVAQCINCQQPSTHMLAWYKRKEYPNVHFCNQCSDNAIASSVWVEVCEELGCDEPVQVLGDDTHCTYCELHKNNVPF